MIDILAGNTNMVVDANRLHDSHPSASSVTGSATGISITNCDAPAGSENMIINNMIYNFNTNGSITGLNNNNSDGVNYYHNTVVINNTTNTNSFVNTRGFYQNGQAERINLRNNLIYIYRTGAGPKHNLYFNTPASTFTSNNNILVNVSTTPATNGVAFLSSNYPTLTAWKASNSNVFDQLSFDDDPMFADTANFNFTPTAVALANKGENVGVALDVNRQTRTINTPDIGAIEWESPLPVKLIDFAAVKSGVNVTLSWSTVTEQELDKFEIERSVDGTRFDLIGTVAAIGNSTLMQFYQYADADAMRLSPALYYRLKMRDKDGSYSYSKIAILRDGGRMFSVTAFPNPVVKEGFVKITTSEAGLVKMTVTNANGAVIGIVTTRLQAGVNILTIPSHFIRNNGLYILTIEAGDSKHVTTLLK